MDAKELAEHAKRVWGKGDSNAADRYIGLILKIEAVEKTVSDVPETLPLDGQSTW